MSRCGEDDMQLMRKMFNEIRERGMDLLFGDQVIIVQDQHQVLVTVQHKIDEYCQDGYQRWYLWRLQELEQWGKAFGLLLIQGGENIRPEEPRVIILLVQRHPCDQRMAWWQRFRPGTEQHRFAEASSSRDERQGIL